MSSLETIRAALPPDAALVEYFSLKDQFIAAIVTRDGPGNRSAHARFARRESFAPFHFQISKFKLGADYTQTFEQSMLESVQAHLRQLYDEVLATFARIACTRNTW